MTSIGDKAAEGGDGGPEVSLAREAAGFYRLESETLTHANQITEKGEFPEHGEFLKTTALSRTGKDLERNYVECTWHCAEALQEAGIGEGDTFMILSTTKDMNGYWKYEIEDRTPEDGDDG